MQSLLKVALLSLMLIAVSLGPVPAGTKSQLERPDSVAQMGMRGPVLALPKSQPERPYSVAQMPGTACSQTGAISCIYGTRVMCICSRYPRCSWVNTGRRC
jgi:hypothetical protein